MAWLQLRDFSMAPDPRRLNIDQACAAYSEAWFQDRIRSLVFGLGNHYELERVIRDCYGYMSSLRGEGQCVRAAIRYDAGIVEIFLGPGSWVLGRASCLARCRLAFETKGSVLTSQRLITEVGHR